MTTSCAKKSGVICITGMHRSGTSLFTNWLSKCGMSIEVGNLIPAAHWNRHGHFEDQNIVDLHSTAINRIDPNSQGWKLKKSVSIRFTEKESAIALRLAQAFNSHPLSGWKDPRALFFLFDWKQIDPSFKSIILYRSANEVIPSLINRYQITPKHDINTIKLLKITFIEAVFCYKAHIDSAIKYKSRHPNSTLLIPIDMCIKENQKYFNIIEQFIQKELNYEDIEKSFDQDIFGSNGAQLPRYQKYILDLFSYYYDKKICRFLKTD